jgi:hypothetical protein
MVYLCYIHPLPVYFLLSFASFCRLLILALSWGSRIEIRVLMQKIPKQDCRFGLEFGFFCNHREFPSDRCHAKWNRAEFYALML